MNKADDFLSAKQALLGFLESREWEKFMDSAREMQNKNALWAVLKKDNAKIHLAKLLIKGAKCGFIKDLFDYDPKESISLLRRLDSASLIEILSLISPEENLLIANNAKKFH